MSSNNAATEAALLEIAKDLLQASDDLASVDPAASAKLAHEAYEIGRDLGIVRDRLDGNADLAKALGGSSQNDGPLVFESVTLSADDLPDRPRDADDDSDADLLRILDRQKAILPKPVELAPVRKPSRGAKSLTFESAQPRRSGWFGWMRSREWRHAG